MSRNLTITYSQVLATEECCNCGITFAMPRDFQQRMIGEPGTNFYCPSGHAQHYVAKTDAQRERERAEKAERELKFAEARESAQRREREAAERSARAYRGHLTRLRNRIAAGVCPVQDCRRNFADVKAHIETQHPEWAHEHADALT